MDQTARACVVGVAVAFAVQLSVRFFVPSVGEPMAIGVIRPPPDCAYGLYEICDAPQGDEQCHWEKRFSCFGQPAYRRIYRDPFKEE